MIENALILPDPAEVSKPVGLGTRRLAGVVLLGGSVRPTRFHTAVGRSLLDLPYQTGKTLLDEWCDQTAGLAARRGEGGGMPLRVLSDKTGIDGEPGATGPARQVHVRFDHDPSEWRGTGGVLRDISTAYAPDDLLVVANAAQFLLRPLAELVAELDALRADLAVLAHRDGTPSTLMLVRCGCLKSLPELGFLDMKEQAIPLLAAAHDVRVVCAQRLVTLGLRTAQTYLAGLRALHAAAHGGQGEEWRSAFAIIEEGAAVDPRARLHDSVVLRGGRVGAGAVLVRSVVCGGGIVPRNAVIVDKLVTGEGQSSAEEGP